MNGINDAKSDDRVPVMGSWVIKAPREAVYAVISDFEAMPANFPAIARKIKVISREGNILKFEAEAGSFGKFLPTVKIEITAELLPGKGYRCHTHNLTFNTKGEEELLLSDVQEGTRIDYTYFVTVKRKMFKPLFSWLVNVFGLPFWKRSFVDRLNVILKKDVV